MELTTNTTPAKPSSSVMFVDTDMATRWLEHNLNNRTVSTSTVLKYRSDMLNGAWEFDGSPIRFSETGRLLDGQHRLLALAGIPNFQLPFTVIRGLNDHAQMVMDQGRKRNAGSQLALRGYKHGINMASVANLMIVMESGLLFKDTMMQRTVSTAMIEQWLDENPDDAEWVQDHLSMIRLVEAPPSVVGAACVMCRRVDPELTDIYLAQLARGEGLYSGDPAFAVRNYLGNQRKYRNIVSKRNLLEVTFRGFNAARTGRSLKTVRPSNAVERNFPWPK